MPGGTFELAYCTPYNASTIVRHSLAKGRALRQTTTSLQPASLGIRLPQSSWKCHSRRSVVLSAAQVPHHAEHVVVKASLDLPSIIHEGRMSLQVDRTSCNAELWQWCIAGK